MVGLGRIGQLVAQRLAAFGTHVIAYDPYVPPAQAASWVSSCSRWTTCWPGRLHLSAPAQDQGRPRVCWARRRWPAPSPASSSSTPPAAVLIDEHALADAIRSGHVRGAGLDVFATEPCTDSPLFDLPQVVVTPHLGASTSEAQDRAGTDVAEA